MKVPCLPTVLFFFTALAVAGASFAQETAAPAFPQPVKEHEFLKQFEGEWECESELFMGGDEPVRTSGSMTGSLLGGFWATVIVRGEAMGSPYLAQGTFGYDSNAGKYVGTWVDSMSGFMWKYQGHVDGNKLVLHSEGPDMSGSGKMIKAVDTWEFRSKDEVVLTGEMEGADGNMVLVVRVTCRRQ